MVSKQLPVKEPEVSFVDATPHSFTFTSLKVDIKLRVTNPNPIGLTIDRLDLVLYINDQKTVTAPFHNVTLKANGSSPLNTTVVVPYTAVGMSMIGALKSTSGIRYKLVGVSYVKTPLGVVEFPVTIYKNS